MQMQHTTPIVDKVVEVPMTTSIREEAGREHLKI